MLGKVNDETIAHCLGGKLEDLYIKKSLTNKLFGLKMNASKSLDINLDEFKKVTVELGNIGEKNQAVILLNSLP